MAGQSAVEQALLNQQKGENPRSASFANDDDSDFEGHDDTNQGAGITDTAAFHTLVGIIIGLNTLLVVIEASLISNMPVKPFLEKLELIFTMIYVLELGLRLKERGFNDFFRGRGCKWNIFDFIITVVGVADAAVTATNQSGTGASAARLFRMMRLMRLFRAMRFLQDMDRVLKVAGEATIQFFFVVLVVVFIAGIVTTNMLWDAPDEEVSEKFAYLGRSMWTMYCLMTMDDWVSQVTKITEVKPEMIVFFGVYIFIAAITLMSLTPAIFVQLNMQRKEQEAEEKVREEKRLFIKQHAAMMEELFNTVDVDHNNKVSMNEMRRVIKDKKLNLLKDTRNKKFKEEGMLRNLMLSIFDFWNESSFDYASQNHEFSKEEFTEHIIEKLATPNAELLFCGVATRKMAHDLSEQMMTEIGKLQKSFDWAFRMELAQLRRAVEANGVQLSPGAECEDEAARASLRVTRSLSHAEPLQSAEIATSYSQEDVFLPPRQKEKEHEAIMRTPEPVMRTPSAFAEALALAADDLKEKKTEKGQHRSSSSLAESASRETSGAVFTVGAGDHPPNFGPNSVDSDNPYQWNTCTDHSYGESVQQASDMEWERWLLDKSQRASQAIGTSLDTGSGGKASRDSSLWRPLADETKGPLHQVQESQSDDLSVGAKTQSHHTSFYVPQNGGSKSQSKHTSVGPLHGNSICGEDLLLSLQVPLMHDMGSSMGQPGASDNPAEKIRGLAVSSSMGQPRALDNPAEKKGGPANQEPLVATGPAAAAAASAASAAASAASLCWKEQHQNQRRQPSLQSRDWEEANEDAIRIRINKPDAARIRLIKARSSRSLNLPAAMSSTGVSTPPPTPAPGRERPLQKFLARRPGQRVDLGLLTHIRVRSHSPGSENVSLL